MRVAVIAAAHMSRSDTDTLSGFIILTRKVLDGDTCCSAGLFSTLDAVAGFVQIGGLEMFYLFIGCVCVGTCFFIDDDPNFLIAAAMFFILFEITN